MYTIHILVSDLYKLDIKRRKAVDTILKASLPKLREKLLEALQAVLPIAAIVLVLCFTIAPVSPRQKSMYGCPSTQVNSAPCARSTNRGTGVLQSAIQCRGTPNRKFCWVCCASSWDLGCWARNVADSRSMRAWMCSREMVRGLCICVSCFMFNRRIVQKKARVITSHF